jgi:hypothetical protein
MFCIATPYIFSPKSKGRGAFGIGVCLCITLFFAGIVWELRILLSATSSQPPQLDAKALADIENRLRAEVSITFY